MGETLGQLRATQVMGKELHDSTDAPAGTIDDLLVDPGSGRVVSAEVTLGGPRVTGNQHVLIAWTQLRPDTPVGAGYRVDLTPQALNAAPNYGAEAASRSGDIDVKTGLLGREAVSAKDETLGTVADIVFEKEDGKVDLLLVSVGTGVPGTNLPRAVAWDKLALPQKQDGKLVLRESPQQVASAPQFGLKAQRRPGEASPPAPVPSQQNAPLQFGTVAPSQTPKWPR
ncbi:MAG TPA: PRC-barrel domain-containing protein [Stellaceae bacterium]|nr:PRC-barrel domain-containing protein [Stellaceae bacterium]